jgi:hypothetical protein
MTDYGEDKRERVKTETPWYFWHQGIFMLIFLFDHPGARSIKSSGLSYLL